MKRCREHLSLITTAMVSLSFALQASGQWTQQGLKLVGSNATGIAQQGCAVSLSADGNTAVIGGVRDNEWIGAAWIFLRGFGVWNQYGKIVGTGNIGASYQGKSVSVSGDGYTVAVGGGNDDAGTGAVWIFTRSIGRTWIQQGNKLVGTGASGGAVQGGAVALSADGNTLLVGGYKDDNNLGAAWVFVRSSGVWSQQGKKLLGTDNKNAFFGYSVALSADGNTAIIGGCNDNNWIGAAWVFTRSETTWSQQGKKLVCSGAEGQALFGTAVALSSDGNTAAIGGAGDTNAVGGAVWIFTRSGGVWTQQGSKLVAGGNDGPSPLDLGLSVSLSGDGNRLITGGRGDNYYRGAAWVFGRSKDLWAQEGKKLVGTGGAGPQWWQGYSVALSADGLTALSGGAYDNNQTGATWIFTRPASGVSEVESPRSLVLHQNYPNPFNPTTTIRYELPASREVCLEVYDMLGREVSLLVKGKMDPGVHEVKFDGRGLSSGTYYYRLTAGSYRQTYSCVLVR